jgi:NADPH-dependent curcumin reductase CurA
MAPVEVTSILFKDFVNDGKVPEDNFVVNKDHSIDPDNDLRDGQIFLRLLYISVDPYMRTRMRKSEVIACWSADQERSRGSQG